MKYVARARSRGCDVLGAVGVAIGLDDNQRPLTFYLDGLKADRDSDQRNRPNVHARGCVGYLERIVARLEADRNGAQIVGAGPETLNAERAVGVCVRPGHQRRVGLAANCERGAGDWRLIGGINHTAQDLFHFPWWRARPSCFCWGLLLDLASRGSN